MLRAPRHRRMPLKGLLRRRGSRRDSGVCYLGQMAGEFGEDRREPMPWVDIPAEFVVPASEVLDKRVSGTDHPC